MQKDFLNPFVDFFTTTIPNAVSGFATDVINAWNSVLGPIEHVIGAIINAYNDIPLLPNVTNPFAPKPLAVNVPNFGFPFAASGGNINGPTIVGELGPELFVPPMPGGYVVPNHQLTLPVFSGLSGGSNGPVMHVDVQNLNHDTDVVALGSQLAFLRRGQRL
jgi:hypothetical protein